MNKGIILYKGYVLYRSLYIRGTVSLYSRNIIAADGAVFKYKYLSPATI